VRTDRHDLNIQGDYNIQTAAAHVPRTYENERNETACVPTCRTCFIFSPLQT